MANNNFTTNLRCVNPIGTNFSRQTKYQGRMLRSNYQPTNSYEKARFFETSVNGRTVRANILRFIP